MRGVRNTKFGYRCSKTGPNGKIRGGLFSGGGKGEKNKHGNMERSWDMDWMHGSRL